LYGTGETIWEVKWEFTTKSRTGTQDLSAKWLGLCNYIDEEYQRVLHNKNIKNVEELLHDVECPSCCGSRLKPELLNTEFLGENIFELSQLSISACLQLIDTIETKMGATVRAISQVVLPGVIKSLQTIEDLGLGYLSLDRAVSTLSGGERQRVTLAGQLSTHLFGVIYVLDEPTIGLDSKQVAVLSGLLKSIVANGNTVIVVEHDANFIQTADYLIEMGPGAGRSGGEVMFQGKLSDVVNCKDSVTYQLLHQKPAEIKRVYNKKGKAFGVKGASANNLKQIDVKFYTNQIIAVKGVSGSGNSSLVKDVLYSSWQKNRPVGCASFYGLEQFEEVLLIDQTALKQSRLSTPATYTGIIEHLKTEFSKTASAKAAGFKKADFSYQSKNGKCKVCNGQGKLKTSMDFMSDIWLTCDTCRGLRYNEDVLNVKLQNLSIGELLQKTVKELITFFKSGVLVDQLKVLEAVGVGHLSLGQSGDTLSGGEAQRLKLATALLQKRAGKNLYLFDEPSTGLHYFDILKLSAVFQSMVAKGDTVLFIEHNETLIRMADQVITLGPGSGESGGRLIG
jgi:excinuclease ABC subunit A